MTKAVVAALVAVVLGLTATPADARPLRQPGERRVEPVTACARIVVVPGERGDCAVHVCRKHRYKHRGHRHVARKHHHRGCIPAVVLRSRP